MYVGIQYFGTSKTEMEFLVQSKPWNTSIRVRPDGYPSLASHSRIASGSSLNISEPGTI